MRGPAALILNTSSGAGCSPDLVDPILRANGVAARIVVTSNRDDITRIATQVFRDGYPTLVAGGGDGTVRAVAAALAHTDGTLGVLPLGTMNHFAKDLKLPMDLPRAAGVLKNGTERVVDVTEVNGNIFVNNSGLGLYPLLVTQREKLRSQGESKWIAFFRAALETLRRFPYLDVQLAVDGQVFKRRTPFVFVGNNRYRMEGIRFASRESLAEGVLFLVVAQRRIGRWELLRLPFRAVFGHMRHERDFTLFTTREARIASRRRRLLVSLDGEVMPLPTPLEYKTRQGALRVIAPDKV